MRPPRPLLLLAACALAAACGSPAAAPVRSHAAPLWFATTPQRPVKVLVVVEENHTQRAALQGMPYLSSLASTYGRTAAYKAITHPSLPNYLALAGGSTFGIRDDRGPASHHLSGPSVFDRVIAGGRTAKSYVESMPGNCAQSATTKYAVKHNPWAYFSDAGPRASCRRFDVPAGTTASGALRHDIDAGTLPTVGLLVPDICHDGHDCSLATADGWLKSWLSVVMQGADYRSGRLAVVVTFDEDDTSSNNTVLTVVVSPYTAKVVSTRALNHYSLTRYLAELTGTTPLRAAATAPSMRADFRL
ncbi:MAG: putative hydrolase [Frankiales bacterium]|nr:putative hydrolase [Frankiales bacterium]